MRKDDALAVLIELDNLERKFLVQSCLCAVFLNEMLRSGKSFNAFFERDNGAFLKEFGYFALMYAAYCIFSLKYVPGILFELLVAEAQTAVVLVNVKNDNIYCCTNLCEL